LSNLACPKYSPSKKATATIAAKIVQKSSGAIPKGSWVLTVGIEGLCPPTWLEGLLPEN
jgi:hypothetical protein